MTARGLLGVAMVATTTAANVSVLGHVRAAAAVGQIGLAWFGVGLFAVTTLLLTRAENLL